ncbi:MAG: hypothetical protein EBZ74_00910 [Planctomycetia bacterium]|nr:hypothetical protein [Planctomycetia bacterium]
MSAKRFVTATHASRAFSSLLVTAILAAISVLIVMIGGLRNTRAEATSSLLVNARVEDPAAVVVGHLTPVGALPARPASEAGLQTISRQPLGVSKAAQRRPLPGPAQEWLGVSRLAFPLLVNDLVGARRAEVPVVLEGVAVGVR